MTAAASNFEVLTNPALSKGELAFSLLKNESDSEGSLAHILDPLVKTMTREDFMEYAVLLKMAGMGNLEISTKIPYTPSWIKKYVNPIVARATKELDGVTFASPGDTLQPPIIGNHSHDLFNFGIANLEKETRQFGGWGSVEVKDSQKDKLPTDALEKIMPTYMKRGSPIMFGHSNRHVGKVLKFEFKDKEVDGKQIPGLWLEGQIFKDYKIDDEAWKAIKLAQANGKPVLSLGATPIGSPSYECDGTECFRKFDDLQLFEFTVTDLAHGQQGANPEATIEMAKAADIANTDEELALADGDLEKAFPPWWDIPECVGFLKKVRPKDLCKKMQEKQFLFSQRVPFPKPGQDRRKSDEKFEVPDDLFKASPEFFLEKRAWKMTKRDCWDTAAYDAKSFCQSMRMKTGYSRLQFDSDKDCERKAKMQPNQLCDKLKRVGIVDWDTSGRQSGQYYRDPSRNENLPENQPKPKKKRFGFLRRSDKADESAIDNVWLAGKFLKMKKDGTLPDDAMALVDLQLASCGNCQEEFESLLKAGKSETEAKVILFKEISEAIQSLEKELEEMAAEEDQEITKEDFATFMQEIMKGQQQIIALLSKEEPPEEELEEEEEKQGEVPPPPPKKEEEEEEEEKADEDEPEDEKDPALTLSKFNITPEQYAALNKQMGYVKIGSSPAPGLASRNLTKGTEEKKTPSLETQIEAVRTGDLSLLEE